MAGADAPRSIIPALLRPGGPSPEVASTADWAAIIDDAATHGVIPLLHELNLDLPSEVSARVRDVYLHSALRAQSIYEDAAAIARKFREVGVQPLALKGLQLAFSMYAEPALRPMNDIDFLVRPSDLPGALEALRGMGYAESPILGADMDYTEFHHVRPLFKAGSVHVELHRALEPRVAPFSTDLDGLWSRTSPMRLGDVDLLVMARDDLLLHLCTHAAYNHLFDVRLLALMDVATVARDPELDWSRLVRTANADGRARYAYAAVRMVERLWPDTIPVGRIEELEHAPDDDEIAAIALEHVAHIPVEVPAGLRALRSSRGAGSIARALMAKLLPPRAAMRRRQATTAGSWSIAWQYLVRPFDLLARRGPVAAALLFRTEGGRSVLHREERQRRIAAWAGPHPDLSHRGGEAI